MKLKVVKSGAELGSKEVDVSVFGDKVMYRTLKNAVVMFRANQRQGTVKTKGRSEVRGTNAKPYRQKHTGRARAGTRKSPIWRGGGVVFGPRPRDYSYHMPAKARRVALRGALYGMLEADQLVLFDASAFTEPSAKAARAVLSGLDSPRRPLVVTATSNVAVWKSFRNFPGAIVRAACDLCAHDVAAAGMVLVEEAALEALAARVGTVAKGGDA